MPAPLHAGDAPKFDARTDRLVGFTARDLARIEPFLVAGPVSLIEFADTDADELPGVHIAARVRAPAKQVAALIGKPSDYPRYMRTLDEVSRVERHGSAQAYDWRWGMGPFDLGGRNVMTSLAPPPERAERGYRFVVDSQSGDFGVGRMVLRVLPRGEHASLLMVSMRLDLRRSNYLARRLSRAARSINRTANMSLAYAMVLSFRSEAERRAGAAPVAAREAVFAKPAVNPRKLGRLLDRGDLVLMRMAGDTLEQIAVLGMIHRKRSLVRGLMLDANAFGSALVPGGGAKVVTREGARTVFDWSIDLPLVGTSGRMQMLDEDPVLRIEAVDGALEGGRWHFETRPASKRTTFVTGWASFDVADSTWLVRALASADPYLAHGMTAASEVMLVRALRKRANDAD
jgi:hypothetical protein